MTSGFLITKLLPTPLNLPKWLKLKWHLPQIFQTLSELYTPNNPRLKVTTSLKCYTFNNELLGFIQEEERDDCPTKEVWNDFLSPSLQNFPPPKPSPLHFPLHLPAFKIRLLYLRG